jgi:hypothetical protein
MFLVEWEAIAAGLPVVIIPGSAERELIATSRQDLIAAGWDRDSAKHRWVSYIEAVLAA